MKRFLLAVVALVVCSGQSCLQPFDRLAVNDELRATCEGSLDSQILDRIQQAEARRLNGDAESRVLADAYVDCDTFECFDCWVAIVDQIHDNAP